MKGQIIAIGGGGFLTGSDPGLDQYVLNQCPSTSGPGRTPKIGYLGTAAGDADIALVKFYSRFNSLECETSHLPLFARTPSVKDWIQAQDVIYVGGGNTKSMLAVWEEWGLTGLLEQALADGTVLAGVSAGAICWFDSGITDSVASILAPLPCLGFIKGSCCPHYIAEPERKPAYEHFVSTGETPDEVAIDDGAAIHFVDGKPATVVSSRPGAFAYTLSLVASKVATRPIESADAVSV